MLAEQRGRPRDAAGPVHGAAGVPACSTGRPRAAAPRDTSTRRCSAVLALAYVHVQHARDRCARVARRAERGELPPFAVPLALSNLEGDAQVDPARPARCAGREYLNSVRVAAERGRCAIAFFATSRPLQRQMNVVGASPALPRRRLRGRLGARRPRGGAPQTARARSWRLSIGYDHDGAVTNACATRYAPHHLRREGRKVVSTSSRCSGGRAGETARKRSGERAEAGGSTRRSRPVPPSCGLGA